MQPKEAVRVLQMALRGTRPAEEDIRQSMDILEKRLEQLKQKSPLFQNVTFSAEAVRLTGRSAAVAVN